jgi:hypothetical protein
LNFDVGLNWNFRFVFEFCGLVLFVFGCAFILVFTLPIVISKIGSRHSLIVRQVTPPSPGLRNIDKVSGFSHMHLQTVLFGAVSRNNIK